MVHPHYEISYNHFKDEICPYWLIKLDTHEANSKQKE